jgi:hypothetical protein
LRKIVCDGSARLSVCSRSEAATAATIVHRAVRFSSGAASRALCARSSERTQGPETLRSSL